MVELKYVESKDNKKLQVKDLITLGLYSALLIILMGASIGIGTLLTTILFGGKIYFATFTSVAAALVCGVAYSLIFNKINKNMAIFILNAILAIFMLVSGHALIGSIVMIIFGIASEYFYRKNNEYLSYLFFNLGTIGAVLPLFFMKENYISHLKARNYPQEKIDLVMNNSSLTTFILIIVLTVVMSYVGCYIGRKLYFKNFDKAGL